MTIWRDASLGRLVAVKQLSKTGIGGSMTHEAALLGAIQSKHVVELLEVGIDPTGEEYLIMEYVDGPELSSYSPVDCRCLYFKLYQIACGLADIHKAGCLHRDIKPDNMKLDAAGIVKIIDFGIGADTSPVLTLSGRGSNGYRGAEYYSPPIHLTESSDIYAFGCVAFSFCFGALDPNFFNAPPGPARPFETARIGTSNAPLSPQISSILNQCLTGAPTGRPTADNIKSILAKHLLFDLHVAQCVFGGQIHSISKSARAIRITGGTGSFEIHYDGLDFIIRAVTGSVSINRLPAVNNMKLPGSCVITIGSGSGPGRAFIPFNVSHPEVTL